jgi:hypothetical protein
VVTRPGAGGPVTPPARGPVAHRFARLLLAVAARRWPAALRDDLHREWVAEVHVLAADREEWRMLRYAASLALSRPARVAPVAAPIRVWPAVRLVLVAPLAALALLAASLVALSAVPALPRVPYTTELQIPLATLLFLGSAVLLTRLGRRWTVAGRGTLPLVLAVTVPGFVVSVLVAVLTDGVHKLNLHAPAYAVFFLGLGLVLTAVTRLATTGRFRVARWTGVLGAVVAGDIAVVLTLLRVDLAPEEALHRGYAPVWLFTAVTDSSFGLPHPTPPEISAIGDVIELDPYLFMLFTGLALGAVLAAARTPVPRTDRTPAVPVS